jgi:outer membrane receptor for ferrienterochelin and colicins
MYRVIVLFTLVFMHSAVYGQERNSLRLVVINADTKSPVEGARVSLAGSAVNVSAGRDGRAELQNIPNGPQTLEIFSPGYETVELKLEFPLADPSERQVLLEVNFEAGEVTVNSTRTGREIEAVPTRVEAIDEEEIDEKVNMRPVNVSMLLSESTGIQVQQTSATSNTQTVRIQGLDGRYTQLLKDGFPAYAGFSGSMSVLEIPPLDLKQVEIIKGPSATLYGAGAIAGVVNFVSKTPEDKPVTSLIINQTSALGTDFSLFNSRKFGRLGYTFLGSANYQREYDVDKDDFTELPRTKAFALSPRLFVFANDKVSLNIGNSFSRQKRRGGDVFAIQNGPNGIHQYFENNDTLRNVTTLNFDAVLDDRSRFVARQSVAYFSRDIAAPAYRFKGDQINSYTDLAYFRSIQKHSFVFGANVVHDRFIQDVRSPNILDRSEKRTTIGAFVQDTVDLSKKAAIEAGFRLDHLKEYGTFALPRFSFLYRFTERFVSRIGYGLGYKTPSIFTEDAETLLFRNVIGIGNALRAERSQGGTLDFNYSRSFPHEIGFSINQMFFYTQISDPLVLEPVPGNRFRFRNAETPIISKGFETNIKATRGIAKLFVGYTFTHAKAGFLSGNRGLALTPRSRVNSSLVFEEHDSFKAGAEFYYASRQILDDRSLTPSTAKFGLFGEKMFGKFSIFVNAENIFDERQSRKSPVVLGPHSNPNFAEIYTHTEGRIFNGGIKIKF